MHKRKKLDDLGEELSAVSISLELLVKLVDHTGGLKDAYGIKSNSEATLEELKKAIMKDSKIEEGFQRLFYENEEAIHGVPSKTLMELGLKNNDTILLKHSMLEHFVQFNNRYLEALEEHRQIKEEEQSKAHGEAFLWKKIDLRQKFIYQAFNYMNELDACHFFMVYPKLGDVQLDFTEKFTEFMDHGFKYIELAVKDFFPKYHKDDAELPKITVECRKKSSAASIKDILVLLKETF